MLQNTANNLQNDWFIVDHQNDLAIFRMVIRIHCVFGAGNKAEQSLAVLSSKTKSLDAHSVCGNTKEAFSLELP